MTQAINGAAGCCSSLVHGMNYVGGGIANLASRVGQAFLGFLSTISGLAAAGWHKGGAVLTGARVSFVALPLPVQVVALSVLTVGVVVLAARRFAPSPVGGSGADAPPVARGSAGTAAQSEDAGAPGADAPGADAPGADAPGAGETPRPFRSRQ